jgi:hypothetical protein
LLINITTYNTIAAIAEKWDRLTGVQMHLQSCNLLQLEKAQLNNISFYYVLIYKEQHIIGIAYLQLIQINTRDLAFTKKRWRALACLFLKNSYQALICGNMFRVDFKGYHFFNDEDEQYLMPAMRLFKKQHTTPITLTALKDVPAPLPTTWLKKYNYTFFKSDVTMELQRKASWLTSTDYFESLNKKYKKRAAKIVATFSTVKEQPLHVAEILQYSAIINQLYGNVLNKQMLQLGAINANYFYELKKTYGEKFEIVLLWADKTPIGFYTYIFYTNSMETHYIGINYDYNNQYNTYFNILFLSVQKMIERKYERLELGRTAKEAKANIGAMPKQIFNYVHVTNIFARLLLFLVLKKFNGQENSKQLQRNPFKT